MEEFIRVRDAKLADPTTCLNLWFQRGSTSPKLPFSIVSISLRCPTSHALAPNNENKHKAKDHSPNNTDSDDHVRNPNTIDPWRQCKNHDRPDDIASEGDADQCITNNLKILLVHVIESSRKLGGIYLGV